MLHLLLLLARWLLAALRVLPAAARSLARAGPKGALHRLWRLHSRGQLRLLTHHDGEPAMLTVLHVRGDVLTKVTPRGLARVDAHARALDELLIELTAARGLIAALVALLFLACLGVGLHRFYAHVLLASSQGLLALALELARDLFIAFILPALVLGLLTRVAGYYLRRAITDGI